MEKHICPRCGQNFPNWQPVHLRCLIARLKWVLIPLALLLLFFIITFIGPMIVDLAKTTTMEIAEAFPTKVSPTKKAVVPTVTIPSSSLYVTSTTTSRPTTTPSPSKTLQPTNTPRPTTTPRPTSTPRPTNTRVPFEPYSAIQECAKAQVLIGDIVVANTDLFIRSSSDNHPSNNIIGHLSPGQQAKVIGGPECSWGWMMWKIRRISDNFEGWVAESNGNNFWLRLSNPS